MFLLRTATPNDVQEIGALFRDTILSINTQDYSEEQVKVWASGGSDTDKWLRKIDSQYFLLALEKEVICGFASLTLEGYIDYMFVHKDYQGKGVAKELMHGIFEQANTWKLTRLTSDVSITALPFFKSKGFSVVRNQKVLNKGIYFTNYHLELFL